MKNWTNVLNNGRALNGFKNTVIYATSLRAPSSSLAAWSATSGCVRVTGLVNGALGMKEIATEDLGDGESKRADQTLADGFPDRASEEVLVQGRGDIKADDPRFTAG